MNLTFFVHLNATKSWLSLSHDERVYFVDQSFAPILAKYPGVTIRFFDAEAFTARCSDIVVFESESIPEYYQLMDAIRDSKVFTVPYFELVDIFPAIEADFV
ncbi:MAG: hypothetical protein QNJ45_07105 [Ardenticatenaceae bacterium]|nr:hypothetical protein [Ardenticatenaceae bacterium]